jgi:hypothetical protein
VHLNSLKVEPNSQDWDALLSACRYAVNRLELPVGIVDDVAVYPFVQDGLPGNQALQSFSAPDVRALPPARGIRTRAGILTVMSQYQETSNVLRSAISNRYVARGILAGSGVGTALPTTVVVNHALYAADATQLVSTISHGHAYEFSFITPNLEAFFYSGGVLQLLMTHTPSASPTAFDASLKALTTTMGRIRVSANATYVMSSDPVPMLVQVPGSNGFNQFLLGGTVLATITNGSSTIVIRGVREDAFKATIYADITPGGSITGTFNALWTYIYDSEPYLNPSSMPVYTPPIASSSASIRGSALFLPV